MNRTEVRAAATGLAAAALVLAWWTLAAALIHGGDWTAFFCSGDRFPAPPSLAFEHIRQIPDSRGFDGQFYHYMAHAPLADRSVQPFIDAPRLRYQRILVPAAAWLLAAGQPRLIDPVYFAVALGLVFLGVRWLALRLSTEWQNPLWALGFLALPGILMAVERMTVPDLAVTALAAGFCLFVDREPKWKIYVLMALACLARESGVLLCAAYCVWLLLQRKWKTSLVFATAAIPWAAWCLFIASRTPETGHQGGFLPFHSVIQLAQQPLESARSHWLALLTRGLDWLAIGGAWLAVFWGLTAVRRKGSPPVGLACFAFALLGAYLMSLDDWHRAYDYGRILSPLAILLVLDRPGPLSPWRALPFGLMLPRMAILIGSDLLTAAQQLMA